jgi:hypothetical protein
VLKKKKVQLLREKLVFFLNGFPQSFYVPFTQNMRSGVQKSPIHSIYSFMKQYKFLNLTILCEKKKSFNSHIWKQTKILSSVYKIKTFLAHLEMLAFFTIQQ